MDVIDKFFGVTKTSLYEITVDGNGLPVIRKIAIASGQKSGVGVDEKLRKGDLVGISECWGIVSAVNSKYKQCSISDLKYILINTSPIVALFLDKELAQSCLAYASKKDFDPRWLRETKEVLQKIGKDHRVFVVSERLWEKLGL